MTFPQNKNTDLCSRFLQKSGGVKKNIAQNAGGSAKERLVGKPLTLKTYPISLAFLYKLKYCSPQLTVPEQQKILVSIQPFAVSAFPLPN
ncbi:MAG: hypothetical protein Ct9H300mP21_10730 [Pseudomonadota bacterium]|nr:MAG: hypothetical protein Ct9H300mP21_10730 [Pseudomonadota bacterium]